jgi:hypothetical protein
MFGDEQTLIQTKLLCLIGHGIFAAHMQFDIFDFRWSRGYPLNLHLTPVPWKCSNPSNYQYSVSDRENQTFLCDRKF